MKNYRKTFLYKGFTLVELVIVIGLVGLIASLTFSAFSALNNRNTIDKEIDNIKSIIQKTRLQSLNAKNGNTHGLTFASTSLITKETGTTSSQTYTHTAGVSLYANNLRQAVDYGATTSLSFAQITGLANATGTLVYIFKIGNTAVATKTITINALGTVE